MSLAPKLFKTSIAEFNPATWTGTDKSGWDPIGDKVLVLPDKAAEIVRGVHMTPDVIARHTMASEAGVIVGLGEGAFEFNTNGTLFRGRKPQVGDRVYTERYAGQLIHGIDKEVYRLMDCSSIGAVLKSGAA